MQLAIPQMIYRHTTIAPSGLRKRFLDNDVCTDVKFQDRDSGVEGLSIPKHNHGSELKGEIHERPWPAIEWYPNKTTYLDRVERLSILPISRPSRVPNGFPEMALKPWVWSGCQFDDREGEYMLCLEADDVAEIEAALFLFKAGGENIALGEVNSRTFPLPKLATRLQQVAHTLHSGIGFKIIRGLEPRRYTARDNAIIYLGITSYIAEIRGCQDSYGSMMSGFMCVTLLVQS